MATVTIHLPEALFERAQAIATAVGRSVEDVLSEIVANALDDELDDELDPALHAALARQIEDIESGRATTRPASDILAELRARHRL